MIFRWKGFEGKIYKRKYPNGSEAWVFRSVDGEPLATITVALTHVPPDGFIYVKNYSENEGILDALVSQGIVKDGGERHDAGFAKHGVATVKKLFEPPLAR